MTDGDAASPTEEQLELLTTLSPFVIAGVLEAKIAERMRTTTEMAMEAVQADAEIDLFEEVKDVDLQEYGVYFLEVLAAARAGVRRASAGLDIPPDGS